MSVTYPRARVVLRVPVMGSIVDRLRQAQTRDVVEFDTIPEKVRVTKNDFNSADECNLTLGADLSACDPRLLGNATVQVFMGDAGSMDPWQPTSDDLQFAGVVVSSKRSMSESGTCSSSSPASNASATTPRTYARRSADGRSSRVRMASSWERRRTSTTRSVWSSRSGVGEHTGNCRVELGLTSLQMEANVIRMVQERDRVMTVRLTEAEKKMVKALAELDGISASDAIRMSVRRQHEARFPKEKPKR